MPVLYKVTMKSQWGPGFGLFVDLNCGWYCQVAAAKWWAQSLGKKMPDDWKSFIPYSKRKFGFHPGDEGSDYATRLDKPDSAVAWEAMLMQHGPAIVSGKLGAADWGALGGVSHFILIVGADGARGELSYKDPLQGDKPCTESFAHLDGRMDDDVYVIDFNALAAKLPQKM